MGNKKMTVSLGGKELVLNFGTGRFYNEFKEAAGYDLTTLGDGFDAAKLVFVVQNIVYAGYVAEKKKNKEQVELTKELVYDLVIDEDTTEIFNEYTALVNPEKPGEQNGQLKEQLLTV